MASRRVSGCKQVSGSILIHSCFSGWAKWVSFGCFLLSFLSQIKGVPVFSAMNNGLIVRDLVCVCVCCHDSCVFGSLRGQMISMNDVPKV